MTAAACKIQGARASRPCCHIVTGGTPVLPVQTR